MSSNPTTKEPIDIIADVVEFYRLNPNEAELALPEVDQSHYIAKEICDALVSYGFWLESNTDA